VPLTCYRRQWSGPCDWLEQAEEDGAECEEWNYFLLYRFAWSITDIDYHSWRIEHAVQQFAEVTGHPIRSHPQFFPSYRELMLEGAFSLQGSMSPGRQILRWWKDNLRWVYLAFQQSVINYAAPGRQLWLSISMLDKLEVAQNKALHIITEQYQSTPLEALRVEAGVESYLTVSKRKCSVSYERACWLPSEHLCK